MELKTLRTFVTVAHLKNFSKAAREMHTVQPTVSRHIAELEAELQTQLFYRTTHQVSLTPSGERLLPEAIKIIENDRRVKMMVLESDTNKKYEIKIGYLATACTFFLPSLINHFRKSHPNVQIKLYEMAALEQETALIENKVDIIFNRDSYHLDDSLIVSELIYNDPLVAVVPKDHHLAEKESIYIRDLIDENIYLFDRETWPKSYDRIMRICENFGFVLNIVHHPKNMRHLVSLIASGLGVSIAPSCVKYILDEHCVFRPIRQITMTLPLKVYFYCYNKNRMINVFVDYCISQQTYIQENLLFKIES